MRHKISTALAVALIAVVSVALTGCATDPLPPTTYSDGSYRTPMVVRTIDYPEGTYKLYDTGTSRYWVWAPRGSTVETRLPAPPPIPTTVVVQSPPPMTTRTVVPAGNGQYMLYGDGGATPYYWVWVPNGTAVPPPPPLPR